MKNKNIKEVFKKFENPIIGASVQAFGRIGLEKIFPNFNIACLNYSNELEKMRKDNINVFCLEESLGKKSTDKRNPTTVIKNKLFQTFLRENSSKKAPIFVLYKSSQAIEHLAKKFNWIIAANKYKSYKKFEDKALFKNLLRKLNIKEIPGEINILEDLHYKKLALRYPEGFVIQEPMAGGGRGTFFIHTEKEFNNCLDELKTDFELKASSKLVITQFIKGYAPSVTACVTQYGILQLPPQLQLIDLAELHSDIKGNGVFCGHDWSAAKEIEERASREMNLITKKIGEFLKGEGFRGIYGIDFLVSDIDGSVFPVELNPRLLGTFPVSTLIQLKNKELPLIAFHVLEFAKEEYKIDINQLNQSFSKNKEGAHFFITTPYIPYKVNGTLKAGVYKIKEGRLKFLRPGYELTDLKNKQEFLLVDGVPHQPRIEESGLKRILRVVTDCQISQNKGRSLNSFGKEITNAVYKALKVEPL
ncbi:MAG: ATP-grasp domain-containing protein [Patescibacteria group bacterium]|nr:ATP-grasp domain-containing protein [Patescibacteria group bacterium]